MAKPIPAMKPAGKGKIPQGRPVKAPMPPQRRMMEAAPMEAPAFKRGGKVHDDAAQDKKLIRAEIKKAGFKTGGRAGKC